MINESRFMENTAITYAKVTMRSKKDSSVVHRMRNVGVYSFFDGRWQWVSGQSTRLQIRPTPANVNPSLFQEYLGRYKITETRYMTVTNENGKLISIISGRLPIELVPLSESTFIRYHEEDDQSDSRIVFERNVKSDEMSATLLLNGKFTWRAVRVQD